MRLESEMKNFKTVALKQFGCMLSMNKMCVWQTLNALRVDKY